MDTPLPVAESRDPTGLYREARRGELKNFTGIDSPYERPERPEVHLKTVETTAEQAATSVPRHLRAQGIIAADEWSPF